MDEIRAKTADIPGILVEVTAPRAGPPTGKPIQVQLGALDPAVLPAAANKVAAILRRAQRHPRPRRRPAAARHRLEDRGRQGGGGQIRRRRQHRRQRRPARHQRPEGDRIPPGRQRQVGRHPGALPARPPQPRPDRRSARADPGGPRADRQFRRSACRRQRVGYINRVNGNRVMTVSANVAEGVQTAKVQQEIAQRACQGRSRLGRDASSSRARTRSAPRRGAFLIKAFGTAIFLIFAILLAQFNKLTSVGLVLTAVVLSTFGVLLGLHDHGPAVRRGDDRHRRDRQCRRDREQQHRADRHL